MFLFSFYFGNILFLCSEVILADFGSAELASPEDRFGKDLAHMGRQYVPVCTPQYRAPDLLLGSLTFSADLDMWSLDCVAAEMCLRQPLFKEPKSEKYVEISLLDAQFDLLGMPSTDSHTRIWMESLPFWDKFYGKGGVRVKQLNQLLSWPPDQLRDCPPQLADFVRKSLQWHPEERWNAATASLHEFLSPPSLSIVISDKRGKRGQGSIVQGSLDDDVLKYLQQCPTWKKWLEECLESNFEPNCCIGAAEKKLRMKREFVGYIDADNPPKCPRLNSEKNLHVTESAHLANFVKALRRRNQAWLRHLTARVRASIQRHGLPAEFLASNGSVFLEECFADNAYVYASVQLLKIGAREDGWHTDGGASLLHASLTLFGSRVVEVKLEDGDCISLSQHPGAFYTGNLCALEHNVKHGEKSEGNYGKGPQSQQVQIAVMLRSDVFRHARARKINNTPGHSELYKVVNTETAKHLAQHPLYFPDLAAVIAESRQVTTQPRSCTS